jgi:hypothetical protein
MSASRKLVLVQHSPGYTASNAAEFANRPTHEWSLGDNQGATLTYRLTVDVPSEQATGVDGSLGASTISLSFSLDDAGIDPGIINANGGTVALPFKPGKHSRVAVKIVGDRDIESLKVVEVK